MVRKQKNSKLNDKMESKLPEWLLKRLKALLIIAGFSFLIFIVSTILHNILDGLSEVEENLYFIIAIVALLVFIITTAGGMVILFKAQQKIKLNMR
jgi:hypothetical protein